MADLNCRMPMNAVTKHLTMNVTVTGVRSHRLRMWLATKLIRLAAWVAGVGLHIEV